MLFERFYFVKQDLNTKKWQVGWHDIKGKFVLRSIFETKQLADNEACFLNWS